MCESIKNVLGIRLWIISNKDCDYGATIVISK